MRGWLIVLMLLLVPAASAHGTPEPREIDTRLLTDTTSVGDYGGPEGALDAGGIDLLALDVYEGTLPGTATPAMVFRPLMRGGDAGDHRIDIHAIIDGEEVTLSWSTNDVESFTSDTFEAVRGPVPVGDGHQQAIEGVVTLAKLGISSGDAITDIRLEAHYDDEPQDDMPGSWYVQGQEVPLPPGEEGTPAQYTPSGPASFFTVEADADLIPAGSDARVALNLTSTLESLDQTLAFSAVAPAGINVTFADDVVSLPAGGQAAISFDVAGTALGTVRVLVESDLGTSRLLTFPLDGAGKIGTGINVDSKDIEPGGSFQYTFTAPGTFEYHCHPHPWMTAQITIVAAQNGTAPETHVVRIVEPADSADWGFEPEDMEIRAGDSILWSNEGSAIHTIMGSTGIGGHDGHDHDHDHPGDDDKDSPAVLILLPLAVALWIARRRT